MRWRVEVHECSGDDRLLRDVLEDASFVLHEQAGERYLTSDRFEALPSAADVHALASRAQSILAETSPVPLSFQIGAVLEESSNGTVRSPVIRQAAPSAGSVQITGQGQAKMVDPGLPQAERNRIEQEAREREYQASRRDVSVRFVSAFKDDSALRVQRLLRKELDTRTLGNIFALIQDDVGGVWDRLTSENQRIRFERSINHPAVFGDDARHSVSSDQPPPKPMHLNEAHQYIRRLAARWLERKAGKIN